MLLLPFSKYSKKTLTNRTIIVFILLFLGALLMRYLNSFLLNDIATNGIITFELAKDASFAESIINSWDIKAKAAAGYSLIFDFIFLVLYSLFLALLIHQINERVWKNTAVYKVGVALIYAQFVAAFFDAIENIALLQLFKEATQFWTSIAYYFASMKFILIALGILFIVISWVVRLVRR
ncbi:MAG: hypothetical protein COA67_02645 [Lutibacter sp.]|nr:MAG: hypothetical protein COA67_02645 [Lutibacter sp.]